MNFDDKRIEQLKRSHSLFLNTDLTLEAIAQEVGLESVEQLRVLWTIADQTGLLDRLGL